MCTGHKHKHRILLRGPTPSCEDTSSSRNLSVRMICTQRYRYSLSILTASDPFCRGLFGSIKWLDGPKHAPGQRSRCRFAAFR